MKLVRLLVILCVAPCLAIAATTTARDKGPSDAPALAGVGSFAVGVTRLDLVDPNRPDLVAPRLPTGAVARYDRRLAVTIWYPAIPKSSAVLARYRDHTPGVVARAGRIGAAFAGAPAIRGRRFPLVVFSHGYSNWATGYADLSEGLASHGYVVAAIDHADADPSNPATRGASFAMVLVSRPADQRAVIDQLRSRARTGALADVYDPDRIALIGYSMGGYGAIATAGAGLDPKSPLLGFAPGRLLAADADGAPLEASAPLGVKALVLFAPWGGAPPLRAWSAAGLSHIRTPTLMIDGDRDDVSDYPDGVRWIYDHLTGADRYLLVYENARHNIVGDGVVAVADRDFAAVEHYEEPVWRRDRLLAINRHFVIAFLDKVLKGDAAHGAYLAAPTVRSDAGVWPLRPGESAGARFAGPDDAATKAYWPGFQRRWALGLELYHADAVTAP